MPWDNPAHFLWNQFEHLSHWIQSSFSLWSPPHFKQIVSSDSAVTVEVEQLGCGSTGTAVVEQLGCGSTGTSMGGSTISEDPRRYPGFGMS